MKKLDLLFLFIAYVIGLFLSSVAFGMDVTLGWDPNSEENLAGYRIFYRQQDQSYNYANPAWEGTETTCTITGLNDAVIYCFVARAFDTEGNESADSNEVCTSESVDTTPPAPPVNLEITNIATVPSELSRIWLEPENGAISAPMEIGQDPAAYNGAYIWSQTGGSRVDDPATSSSYVDVDFTVTHQAAYLIRARIIAPTGEDDSFWVQVDGGEWAQWHTIICDTWSWDRVDSPEGEVIYTLAPGSHVIRIAQREDGTKMDTILITDDIDFTPEL